MAVLMHEIPFDKMHGLGNDFVIIDARGGSPQLSPRQIRRIADRHRGVGFDQLILIEPSHRAEAFMRIYNADGSEAEACGNATRCVARKLLPAGVNGPIGIETLAGILRARRDDRGGYCIDMGSPALDWHAVPLAAACDTLHLQIGAGPLDDPVGVGMGNPHAVFFVRDVEAIDLAALGPGLERHPLFPERANIGVATVVAPDRLRLRVWERGVGLTLACGSGACAAMVAAVRRGLVGSDADVIVDGGVLRLRWREGEGVVMSGPASLSYSGVLAAELLAGDVP